MASATPSHPPGGTPGGAATTRHPETASQLYHDAAAAARSLPGDELLSLADALRAELAWWDALPDIDDHSREVVRLLCHDRLAAVADELVRRERLAADGRCCSPSSDHEYQTWRRLAVEVRARRHPRPAGP